MGWALGPASLEDLVSEFFLAALPFPPRSLDQTTRQRRATNAGRSGDCCSTPRVCFQSLRARRGQCRPAATTRARYVSDALRGDAPDRAGQ